MSLLGLGGAIAACGASGSDDNRLSTTATGTGASSNVGGAAAGGQGQGGSLFGGNGLGPGDADGDGISDEDEGKNDPNGPTDTDNDGTPDYLDTDSDADGLPDKDEGLGDWDMDGIPNFQDPINNGPPTPITLTAITTPFTQPIGIDYHEPTNSVVLSANYPTGVPYNFERIEQNGNHQPFSNMSGLTEEVKIATARSNNAAGFLEGELFVGSGVDGVIVKISPDGTVVQNPWVDLPGATNGLMRGSLYVDRSGLFGGELLAATTIGELWRVTAAAVPTLIASVGVHLEGLVVVPNFPARYGPLAGKIIAGAEEQVVLWAFDANGNAQQYNIGVAIEDIDLIMPYENFFGVNFGTSQLLGAPTGEFQAMYGDILLAQETHTGTGLYRLKWDGSALVAEEIPLNAGSATVGQWEHVTFAPAGINEIPEVPPPN